MRKSFVISICYLLVLSSFIPTTVWSGNVKQGDKVTISTPETVARLCPHPNCGQNQHITRIPKGTVLKVEGIMTVKSGRMKVTWFEVTYKGKKGWISVYDTNRQ